MTASRPLVVGLAVSAAINVFLIGGLAGMTYVRLTAPAPAPVIKPAASPRPAAAAPAVISAPAAPTPTAPKPAHHASHAAAPPPVAPAPPPPPPPAKPAADSANAAPARPPLVSAGDGLSPESREGFRRALNQANKMNRPLSQQARAEREAALSAMGAPGYDVAEVARRLSTARALDQQARANVEAALAAFIATLSPQERAVLADGLVRVYAPPPAAPAKRPIAGPN